MPSLPREPTARTMHVPSPAPTIVCSVQGGEWTKSPRLQRPPPHPRWLAAIAAEDEKGLLCVLTVVDGHGLAGLECEQVHAKLREGQDPQPLGFFVRLEATGEGQELHLVRFPVKPAGLASIDDEPPVARGNESGLVCSPADASPRSRSEHRTNKAGTPAAWGLRPFVPPLS